MKKVFSAIFLCMMSVFLTCCSDYNSNEPSGSDSKLSSLSYTYWIGYGDVKSIEFLPGGKCNISRSVSTKIWNRNATYTFDAKSQKVSVTYDVYTKPSNVPEEMYQGKHSAVGYIEEGKRVSMYGDFLNGQFFKQD